LKTTGISTAGELSELIEFAARSKVLSGASLQFAHDVRRAGNRALHYGSLTDKDTSEVLLKVRLVLMDLFGTVDLPAEIARFAKKQKASN
jgi:hypothetical protein